MQISACLSLTSSGLILLWHEKLINVCIQKNHNPLNCVQWTPSLIFLLLPGNLVFPLYFSVNIITNLDSTQAYNVQDISPHTEAEIRNLLPIVLISEFSSTRQWTLMAIIRTGSPMIFQPEITLEDFFFSFMHLP